MRDFYFQFADGYWITPDDQIYSMKSKKFLKLYYRNGSKNGRFTVSINGKMENWSINEIHRILKALENDGTIALWKAGKLKDKEE